MRSRDQIEKIKSNFADPVLVEDILCQSEIDHLVNLFDSAGSKNNPLVYKNTGPITLDLQQYIQDPIIAKLISKIESLIGKVEITAGFFFRTEYPHIIHNDDTYELPDTVYKGITVPLKIQAEEFVEYPKLCFFHQNYFHGPAKFFKGDKEIPTYYNKQIYEYDHIDGITETAIDLNTYMTYFTHLKPQWLEGLSLLSVLDWKPGSMIVFDSVKLHCASDFRKLGIKSKLAISIFTKKSSAEN